MRSASPDMCGNECAPEPLVLCLNSDSFVCPAFDWHATPLIAKRRGCLRKGVYHLHQSSNREANTSANSTSVYAKVVDSVYCIYTYDSRRTYKVHWEDTVKLHVYMYILYIYIYICIYIYIYVHTYIMYVACVCVCVCVCAYVWADKYAKVHTHTHIYIYTRRYTFRMCYTYV